MKRLLLFLAAVSGPALAADPGSAQENARNTLPESGRSEHLPPGAIQGGTLANAKLIADTAQGVAGMAATLGIKPVEKAQPYVTESPQGQPGSRAWRELWIVSGGGMSAAFDIRFAEDGIGGATWSIEVPTAASVQKPYVAAAREFVRLAQAGDVDRMIELTSSRTVRQSNPQQLSESYRTYVVPRFKDATVTWEGPHAPAIDEAGNGGWDVIGRVQVSGRFVSSSLSSKKTDDTWSSCSAGAILTSDRAMVSTNAQKKALRPVILPGDWALRRECECSRGPDMAVTIRVLMVGVESHPFRSGGRSRSARGFGSRSRCRRDNRERGTKGRLQPGPSAR